MAPHSQFGLISARGAHILRLAHQLTEQSDAAAQAAVAALARVPRRVRSAPAFERRVTAELVRASGASRRHAAVVLAFGLGWDPESIAEACRRSRRGVRADVAAALTERTEAEWRETYAGGRWNLDVPPDLPALVDAERARLHRSRTRRALAVGCVVTAVAASTAAGIRVATAPNGRPPTAHIPGLLAWPARGELVRDPIVRDRAIRAWQGVAPAPAGQPYFLYAGDVDGVRLVVLQGYFEDTPAIAVVTDGQLARLRPLPAGSPAALALTYDPGAGVNVTRLLVAPGVTRVAERGAGNSLGQPRPAIVPRRLRDGLSDGWHAGSAQDGATALRLTSGQTSGQFLLAADALLPQPMQPTVMLPPRRWSGLPAHVAPATLADDAGWFGQLCGDARPAAQPVWSGGVPGFAAPIRVVRARCAGRVVVQFLTGAGPGAVTLQRTLDMRPRRDVYAAVVSPPGTLGPAYVIVVGSRRVDHIQVADQRRRTRVVVVRLQETRDLRVFARDGTRITVR